jgi:serine/threonine protein kinase
MSTTSSVIGEGAYGCIHKPSLTCKENKIQSYKNKVSKVLTKSKAKIELEEYASIDNADKSREYYLGKPVECSLDNTPTNIQAIEKCKKGTDLLKSLNDLSLLIMDDGGVNLKEYADLIRHWNASLENVEKTERFFIEFHRIFRGITVFIEKGILHFDMKPQNIVYIAETGRMNIIDFGLTVSLKDKLAEIESSINGMARYHWSYPFEFFFLNKNEYETFAKMPKSKKEEYYQSILQEIAKTPDSNTAKAFQSFYSFVMDETTDSDTFSEHMTGFYQTLVDELTMKNYTKFVKQSITSVDVYGLGIALLYVLKNTKHLLNEKLHTELCNLGNNMVCSQLSKRITAPAALSQYESILTENGVMEKYKISFANHKIVHGEPIPKNIEQSIESIKINDVLLNNTALEENAVSVDILHKGPVVSSKKVKTLKKRAYTKRPNKLKKTVRIALE